MATYFARLETVAGETVAADRFTAPDAPSARELAAKAFLSPVSLDGLKPDERAIMERMEALKREVIAAGYSISVRRVRK